MCSTRAHCHVKRAQRHGHLRPVLRRALRPAPKEGGAPSLGIHSPHYAVPRLVAFGGSLHVARQVARVLRVVPRLAQEQPAALPAGSKRRYLS